MISIFNIFFNIIFLHQFVISIFDIIFYINLGKTFKWHRDCSCQEGLWAEESNLWHWGESSKEKKLVGAITQYSRWILWILQKTYLQVNTAKAEAEMAYGLQASKVQARIKEEEMQVTSPRFLLCNTEYRCKWSRGSRRSTSSSRRSWRRRRSSTRRWTRKDNVRRALMKNNIMSSTWRWRSQPKQKSIDWKRLQRLKPRR